MELPKYITISVNKRIKLDFDELDREYYEREGFTEDEVKNELEQDYRNFIWQYITDNDIKIIID